MRPGLSIPLSREITVLGQRYQALTLRRAKGRHIRAVRCAGSDDAVARALLAKMAGVPVEVIDGLDPADQERLAASAQDLLPKGV